MSIFTKATLIRDSDLDRKEVKVGFSWTTLLFGFFPSLFRGHWNWAVMIFVVQFLVGAFLGFLDIRIDLGGMDIVFDIVSWVPSVVFGLVVNKHYIEHLIEKGYWPLTEGDKIILQEKGIELGGAKVWNKNESY